ncbi:hypothetical protein [Arthrobacter sp. I3]|uniref:hypothetical protein n=1 Tax=Arthrobacter sp. I3 TaxID=218158 RepID=UPI000481C0DE|nr:hypothetical protein [Arthrobacter sp. I3]
MTLSSDLDRYLSHPLVGLDQVVIGADVLDSVHDIVAALPAHNSIAVLTAAVAAGTFASLESAVDAVVELDPVSIDPDPAHAEALEMAYQDYRSLFDAVESIPQKVTRHDALV